MNSYALQILQKILIPPRAPTKAEPYYILMQVKPQRALHNLLWNIFVLSTNLNNIKLIKFFTKRNPEKVILQFGRGFQTDVA